MYVPLDKEAIKYQFGINERHIAAIKKIAKRDKSVSPHMLKILRAKHIVMPDNYSLTFAGKRIADRT
jgi:hypothetical protein